MQRDVRPSPAGATRGVTDATPSRCNTFFGFQLNSVLNMPQTQTSKVFFAVHLLSPANHSPLSSRSSPTSSSSFFPVDQKFHSNSIGSASILRTVQRETATEAAGGGTRRSENFCYKCVGEEAKRAGRGERLPVVVTWPCPSLFHL